MDGKTKLPMLVCKMVINMALPGSSWLFFILGNTEVIESSGSGGDAFLLSVEVNKLQKT